MEKQQNGYVGFYNGKKAEFYGSSSYDAWKQAVAYFKAPKSKQHMVHVVLAEMNGEQVSHVAVD